MDDIEVERENTERVEVNVTHDRQDLINSEEFQQGENKQQEQMYLEPQNPKEEKDINIAMSHHLLGKNSLEDSGGHSDILGVETSKKHTMENQKVSGENIFEKEKSLDKVEPITPNANDAFKDQSGVASDIKMIEEEETGTPEDQAAFMKELESFYKEKGMDFRPPKFYGKILNCLKLYRAVIRLGGYDRVTGAKFWRQIGESFHPPKTCTTVSYAFRIFYEKALLEYERHKLQNGELQLALSSVPEPLAVATPATGSGRARRDAAARAMQGWHAQRHYGYGEISEPIIKDKSLNNMVKREKNLKSMGSVKNKRPKEVEHPVKAARTQPSNRLVTTVVDVGPPADWVKITVQECKDCFEVYALVPGLLREEVRVQSDPEGRLVITGQPEHRENPWGITAFKKVISLPAKIDPLQTSAVVSLHGRLFVRLPFNTSM